MKKLLSVLLALTMIAMWIPVGVTALEASDLKLTASNLEIEATAETVDVVLELSGNPGLTNFSFTVDYDTEAFTLKTITPGADFAAFNIDGNVANSPVTISAYTGGLCTANGTYATLRFDVADGIAAGTYDFVLTKISALGELSMTTFTTPEYEAEMVNGSITVKGSEPESAYVEKSVNLKAIVAESANAGDVITVDVYATTDAASAQTLTAADFTLTYDSSELSFVKIAPSEAVSKEAYVPDENQNAVKPVFAFYDVPDNGSAITVAKGNDVKLATASFKVSGDAEGDVSVGFGASSITLAGDDSYDGYVPSVLTGDTVKVYNIVLTIDTDTVSVGGITELYAKYGESGLYTDKERTVTADLTAADAPDGYRLGDASKGEDTWLLDGEAFVPGTDALKEDGVLSYNIIKVWTVTLSADPADGADITDSEITVDDGAKLLAAIENLVDTKNGYEIRCFKVNGVVVNADTVVNDNTAVVAELYKSIALKFIHKKGDTDANSYSVLKTGTMIALIESDENSVTYTYDSKEFVYAANLGGYALIVAESVSADDISRGISTANEKADAVEYDGDLSGDGITASGDAALLSALLHNPDGNYSDAVRLAADVCSDGVSYVTTADAYWILRQSVGLNG